MKMGEFREGFAISGKGLRASPGNTLGRVGRVNLGGTEQTAHREIILRRTPYPGGDKHHKR